MQATAAVSLVLAITSNALAEPTHPISNIFQPLGTPAKKIAEISTLTITICAGIFVIVASLLAYTAIRFAYRDGDDRSEPPQVYGSNQVELAWTVVPILIVFALSVATARVTSAVQDQKMPKEAVDLEVIGHQWWWEFRYTGLGVVTANEMHVPVSPPVNHRPTFLTLHSGDVEHGFWVPQLAGKTDVIPNRTNTMWIDPKETGIFLGNCSAYCGTEHARMELRVVVDTPADFAKWVAAQQAKAAPAQLPEDQRAFLRAGCMACHNVGGTPAMGKLGPDLTHLMSRQTIAAMETPNTAANLRKWIRDPQQLKPGNRMPAMKMTDDQLNRVVAYLTALE